jgi:oligoribonuclease NrnB/cAMP/cGMP phosphodiesterase (DHH superfamily)
MKLRLLFSVLFIIATTLTAMHQLEHISGKHNSSTCSVCIVDHHSVSGDIIAEFQEQPALYLFDAITLKSQTLASFTKKTTNHANAPPLIS